MNFPIDPNHQIAVDGISHLFDNAQISNFLSNFYLTGKLLVVQRPVKIFQLFFLLLLFIVLRLTYVLLC